MFFVKLMYFHLSDLYYPMNFIPTSDLKSEVGIYFVPAKANKKLLKEKIDRLKMITKSISRITVK